MCCSQVELGWDLDVFFSLTSLELLWGRDPLSQVFWLLGLVALIIRGGDAVVSVLVSDFEELFLLAIDKVVLLHLSEFDF